MRTLRLQSPPNADRIDRDPQEPFQPPMEKDPEEREEPVDDPVDAPGHGEPERRDPQQEPGRMEVSA
jgi:hypothetical protein